MPASVNISVVSSKQDVYKHFDENPHISKHKYILTEDDTMVIGSSTDYSFAPHTAIAFRGLHDIVGRKKALKLSVSPKSAGYIYRGQSGDIDIDRHSGHYKTGTDGLNATKELMERQWQMDVFAHDYFRQV